MGGRASWAWMVGACLACASACGDRQRSSLQSDPADGGAGGAAAGTGGSGGGNPRLSQTPLPLPASQLAPGSWCESDSWCWYNPLPNGDFLRGVAGAGPTDLWLGGSSNAFGAANVLHFADGRWSIVPLPLNFTEAIWASSATDVWFAGALPTSPTPAKEGALAHWDGHSMSVFNLPTDLLGDVWGSGPNDVYATATDFVTDVESLFHWDGHAWALVPAVTDMELFGFPSVSGSGPNDVWVGMSQATFHFDGTIWSRVPALEGVHVLGTAVAAPGDVWLLARQFDGSVAIEHIDASGTPTVSFPQPSGVTFNGIAAVASGDVWVVGGFFDLASQRGGGYASHFDGQSWQRAPDLPTDLESVRNAPGIGVFAVGESGEMARLASKPALASTDLRTGTDQSLAGVFGNSPTDMWAVGAAGTVLHYDGTTVAAVPAATSANLTDVWGAGPNDIWAVGDAGTVVHYDGHAFAPVDVGTNADLKAVFTAQPGDVWIGGVGGTLLHGVGGSFSQAVVPGLGPETTIFDLHGISADDVWLAGGASVGLPEQGFVAHFDGRTWSPVDVLTVPSFNLSQSVLRIWELGPNDVWATIGQLSLRGGGPKVYWHFDGSAWTAEVIDPSMPMVADPFMFPDNDHPSFVFGPHDRWKVDFGGLFQRSTQ